MAILFGLISMVGWGAGDIFVTKASRKYGSNATYLWGFVVAFLFSCLYLPFAPAISDYRMLGIVFVIQALHTISNLAFFKGLEIGNASVVGTIAQSFPFVTVLLSVMIFGETLSPAKILAIFILIVGITLLSFRVDQMTRLGVKNLMTDKGVIYGFFTLIGWGIVFALLRIPAERIGWFWTGYPLSIIALCLFLVKSMRKQALVTMRKPNWFLPIIPFGIMATMADFSYNIGLLHGFTSTIAPIAGASPVLFVILSRIIFKDPLSMQQKIGILIALGGIVFIGFSS